MTSSKDYLERTQCPQPVYMNRAGRHQGCPRQGLRRTKAGCSHSGTQRGWYLFWGTEIVRGPPGRERDWVGPEVVEDFAETWKAGHYRIRDSLCGKCVGGQRASSLLNAFKAFLMLTFVYVLNE